MKYSVVHTMCSNRGKSVEKKREKKKKKNDRIDAYMLVDII